MSCILQNTFQNNRGAEARQVSQCLNRLSGSKYWAFWQRQFQTCQQTRIPGTKVIKCTYDGCLSGPLYPLRIPTPITMNESRGCMPLFRSVLGVSDVNKPSPDRQGLHHNWCTLLFPGHSALPRLLPLTDPHASLRGQRTAAGMTSKCCQLLSLHMEQEAGILRRTTPAQVRLPHLRL